MPRYDSKTIKALARDPAAMAQFASTGKLPARLTQKPPSSPLIELLESIAPRARCAIKGVKVGPELGYMGSRSFHSAEQALLWLRPHHAGASHPAESWRDKRFSKKLTLDDLRAHCASLPESMAPKAQEPSAPDGEPGPCAPKAAP